MHHKTLDAASQHIALPFSLVRIGKNWQIARLA